MRKHPAKNARFLAGVAGLAGVVVASAGVVDNAIVKVDYSQTIAGLSSVSSAEAVMDLTGSATTTTTVAPPSDNTEDTKSVTESQSTVEPLAPTTTKQPEPVRTTKSKAS